MSEKRFFEIDYDEVYYIIDSSRLQRKKTAFEDEEEYQEYCLENSLMGTQVVDLLNSLSEENEQLKDYIDTIFEDNTHICKYLDVEDVQFYCDKNKNYRNPSCLYKKCFDEENLIKIKDEIRRVLE